MGSLVENIICTEYDDSWGKFDLSSIIYEWYKTYRNSSYRDLTGDVSWNIWKLRDSFFFETIVKDLGMVVGRIVQAYKEVEVDVGKNIKSIGRRAQSFRKDVAWCFFDGACQGIKGYCGCGIILNICKQQAFHLQIGVGIGTNTRA